MSAAATAVEEEYELGAAFRERYYELGSATPSSDIYHCEGSGRNITSIRPNPLSPQEHHRHALPHG